MFLSVVECEAYSTGLFCNETCPANCKDGICERYGAACIACIDGFWGTNCTEQCGECEGVACDQDSGQCPICNDGYFGPGCTSPCNNDGCQTCGGDGECTSCKPGLRGYACNFTCSEFCDSDPKTCGRFDSICASGRCISGYYLTSCSEACYEHCGVASDGSRPCDISTGTCEMPDCDMTWFGPQCRSQCSSTCTNMNCNRTGDCKEGCLKGYFGSRCQAECINTCNDGTCSQQNGTCAECEKADPSPLCRTAGTEFEALRFPNILKLPFS